MFQNELNELVKAQEMLINVQKELDENGEEKTARHLSKVLNTLRDTEAYLRFL